MKKKRFFIIFKRISIAKNFLGPKTASLKDVEESSFYKLLLKTSKRQICLIN